MKVHLAAGSYGHVLYGYDIDIDAEVGLAVPTSHSQELASQHRT